MESYRPTKTTLLSVSNGGFGLIEAIVSMAIAAALIVVFIMLIIRTVETSRTNADRLRATLYLRELSEVAKDLEQSNWEMLASATSTCAFPSVCHPQVAGNIWTVASSTESLEGGAYVRSLTAEEVYRDQLTFPNFIVSTPGVLDPNTKKVTGSVVWSGGTMELETYVYNY